MVFGKLGAAGHRQLIQPPHIPPGRQQQPALRGRQRPQPERRRHVNLLKLGRQCSRRRDRGGKQSQKNLGFRWEMIIQASLANTHGISNLMSGGCGKTLGGK